MWKGLNIPDLLAKSLDLYVKSFVYAYEKHMTCFMQENAMIQKSSKQFSGTSLS